MIKAIFLGDAYMPLITCGVYCLLWKAIQRKEWAILLYSLFSTILFSTCDALAANGIHNSPLYHINSIVELWFVSYYLLKKITGSDFSPAFWIINITYTCFFVLNVIFLESFTVLNSNSSGVASLVILFLSMRYLLQLSKSDEILYFQKLPSFWIASGFLIYGAVSTLVLLALKYFMVLNSYEEANNFSLLLSVSIIVKFALIITGLLCYRKQRQVTHLPFLL
jgi:hypothetical protein